jgi:hypothetical protein
LTELQRELLQRAIDLFGKEMTEAESQVWADILSDVDPDACDYAFQNWLRNGKFFPRPANILELVQTYTANLPRRDCDDACKRRHGHGYHRNDVLWLWKKRQAFAGKWTKADYENALKELDGLREGGPPVWRTA